MRIREALSCSETTVLQEFGKGLTKVRWILSSVGIIIPLASYWDTVCFCPGTNLEEKSFAHLQSSYARLHFLLLLFLKSEREGSRKQSTISCWQHRTCLLPNPYQECNVNSPGKSIQGGGIIISTDVRTACSTLHCEQHSL